MAEVPDVTNPGPGSVRNSVRNADSRECTTAGRSRWTSCPAPGTETAVVTVDGSAAWAASSIWMDSSGGTMPFSPMTSRVGHRTARHCGHQSRVPAASTASVMAATITGRSKRGYQPSARCGARDVRGAALAGSVAALVHRHHAVVGGPVRGGRVPFARVAREAVEEDDGGGGAGVVGVLITAGQAGAVAGDGAFGPHHAEIVRHSSRWDR